MNPVKIKPRKGRPRLAQRGSAEKLGKTIKSRRDDRVLTQTFKSWVQAAKDFTPGRARQPQTTTLCFLKEPG